MSEIKFRYKFVIYPYESDSINDTKKVVIYLERDSNINQMIEAFQDILRCAGFGNIELEYEYVKEVRDNELVQVISVDESAEDSDNG